MRKTYTRLTTSDEDLVLDMWSKGHQQSKIARFFDVHASTISKMLTRFGC